jgi:EmrB/QacA subfamily drug resistance transporter
VALMLTMALAAMDATIVATAVPTIVEDIGGFSLFPWMFSIYLLLQAVSTPIYGKLSDQYGRKPVIMTGALIFLVGSVLCGLAWSMVALIAFRGIQGLGAGAIQPITHTIVGDLYSVEERGSVQGYIASVWGVSAVIGPAVGGLLSQYASWEWLFFINIPVGCVALFLLTRNFVESVHQTEHRIDYAGSLLLMSGLSLLILVLLQGGTSWPWASAPVVVLTGLSLVLLGAFVVVERRAAEPVLPRWIFRSRPLLCANLGTLALGMMMMSLTTYLPLFVQEVMGEAPVIAGFSLATMSIGWPIASTLSSRLYMRVGFRNSAMVGLTLAAIAGMLFLLLSPDSPPWQAAAFSFVLGSGLGLSTTSFIVGIQSIFDWRRRGTATGSNMFARLIGGALSVALYGAIVNATIAARIDRAPDDVASQLDSSSSISSMLRDGATDPAAEALVRDALFVGITRVFVGIVIAAVIALLIQIVLAHHVPYIASGLSSAEE